jgi:galactose mutarotase-like enzyme
MRVTTTVTAAADGPVPVSFGYHPYTRLPAGSRDDWLVTLGATDRLLLDDQSIPTGERAAIDREPFRLDGTSLDDAFDAAGAAAFEATAGDARLAVAFLAGYSYAQVFAPVGEQFICFEPMTAPTNSLNSGDGLTVVEPGGSYRAAFRISLSRGAR